MRTNPQETNFPPLRLFGQTAEISILNKLNLSYHRDSDFIIWHLTMSNGNAEFLIRVSVGWVHLQIINFVIFNSWNYLFCFSNFYGRFKSSEETKRVFLFWNKRNGLSASNGLFSNICIEYSLLIISCWKGIEYIIVLFEVSIEFQNQFW